MTLFVLDTDVFTHFQTGHDAVVDKVLATPSEQLAISIHTVREVVSGWLAFIKKWQGDNGKVASGYEQLARSLKFICNANVLPYPQSAADRFDDLKKMRLKIGTSDLMIAASVLHFGGTVVTANERHFSLVPGLQIENWTKKIEQ